MRSRLASLFTVVALVGGTGGAIAVASQGSHAPNIGAASGQYKPGKGCGDTTIHTGPPGQFDNDADNIAGVNTSAADGDKDDCAFTRQR